MLILSYEAAQQHAALLKAAPPFALLVCDEAHRLKNRKAKSYLNLDALAATRRVLLTGTPLQNELSEYYALVSFASPGLLGAEPFFTREFAKPIKAGIAKEASAAERALADAKQRQLSQRCVSMMLRRTQEESARYLPPKTELVVCCRLTQLQKELYLTLLDSKAEAERTESVGGGAARSMARSMQYVTLLGKACTHPNLLYFDHRDTDAKAAAPPPIPPSVWPAHFNPLDESALWEWSGKMRVCHRLLASLRPQRVRVRVRVRDWARVRAWVRVSVRVRVRVMGWVATATPTRP